MAMLKTIANCSCAGVALGIGLRLIKTAVKPPKEEKEVDQVVLVGFGAFLMAVGATCAIQTLTDIAKGK
jgi:hypothetical protein